MNEVKVYDFFKEIYRDNEIRLKNKRDIWKDLKQYQVNLNLRKDEIDLINKFYSEEIPIVFIVGVPRSGTTILTQILAANYRVSYMPNFVAPYYMAPVHKLSKHPDARQEQNIISFTSSYGLTESDWEPHECGYFWQFWFNHQGLDEIDDSSLEKIDWANWKLQMGAIAGYLGKPLLIKSLPFINYKIDIINSVLRNARFIYIKRKPKDLVKSILKARLEMYGDLSQWWSIRPKDIDELKKKQPVEQVYSQYISIKSAIERSFKNLDNRNKYVIDYEELIANPIKTLDNIFPFLIRNNEEFNFKIRKNNTDSSVENDLNDLIDQFF